MTSCKRTWRAIQLSSRRQTRRSGRKLKQVITAFCSIITLGTILLLICFIIEESEPAKARAWNGTFNVSGPFEEQVWHVIDSLRGAMSLLYD
jgi:ABC-type phosphate transport system permease subunit